VRLIRNAVDFLGRLSFPAAPGLRSRGRSDQESQRRRPARLDSRSAALWPLGMTRESINRMRLRRFAHNLRRGSDFLI
jgi:hypothetical protein